MSKLNYTNDDLLESIKLGCMVPISQIALSDEDILRLASEELELDVLSSVLKAREEYNVYVQDQDVNSSGEYRIPNRASGSKLRSVFLKDANNTLYKCSEISVDAVPNLTDYYSNGIWNPMFYVQNDKIIFINSSSQRVSATSVCIHYYLDPSYLVLPERSLKITSINTTTGLIEVAERQIPSFIEPGAKIDLIQYKPQNSVRKLDATVVSVSSNTQVTSQKFITISPSEIPEDLEVGDFIALAGESPVPQLTSNLRPLLAQATICRILESQGDNNNIAIAQSKLNRMVKGMSAIIQDRTEGNPKKVVARNGVSRAFGYNRRNRGG